MTAWDAAQSVADGSTTPPSPGQAATALRIIEPVYGMSRPAPDYNGRRARANRAVYEPHDRAGEFTSVLFATLRHGLGVAARRLDLSGGAEPAIAGDARAEPAGPPEVAAG